VVTHKLRNLNKKFVFIFLSLILIITILISNILPLPLPFYFRIVLVFLTFITIILWSDLWLSTWGKAWILSATLLVISSQLYPNQCSLLSLLVQVLCLIVMMLLYVRKETQEHLLHQHHINAMRVLLRQNPPLVQTVDYSREAIIVLDNTGSIIDSNPQSTLLLSLSESFLMGKPIYDVLGILPNFQPTAIPESGEFIWETQSKAIKHLKFRTRPLLNYDISSGTLLTLFDISEAKKRSEAYVQGAKFSIISQVSAGLAHEIRNPLTTIKGFMQLITPAQWPESFRPYQQLILDEIQTIDQVLDKFVLLTSPTAPQMKPVNIIDTIQAMVQMIQPISLMQEITIVLELSAHSIHVMGDDEQLLQALLSVLNNAIEASPKEGKVIIRLTEHESYVRISIIDNGPGIPDNLRHRVLDPFFTTHKEGTGLGLTIAQQIILAHQGKLHFSKPPCGTEVLIDLPCLLNFTNTLSA
jgi:signal transduction histidine kinase